MRKLLTLILLASATIAMTQVKVTGRLVNAAEHTKVSSAASFYDTYV